LQDETWDATSDNALSADTIKAFAAPFGAPIY
jgi:hypothetical protein